MTNRLFAVVRTLVATFAGCADLVIENLALRQQLAAIDFFTIPTATFRAL